MNKSTLILTILLVSEVTFSQPIPGSNEKIDFLVCAGPEYITNLGKNIFDQSIYILVPMNYQAEQFSIRIFDPDNGGENDLSVANNNTETKFTVNGTTYKNKTWDDIWKVDKDAYNMPFDTIIYQRTFSSSNLGDNKWITLCTINKELGIYNERFDAKIFKINVKGISGDDLNMFRLFISENAIENIEIYGANSFRLLTACKLKAIPEEVSNYSFIDYPIIEAGYSFPYIDSSAIMAKLYVNGLTKKGLILINSASKCGWIIKPKTIESNQHWYHYYFKILKQELNSSIKLSFCIPETYQNEELIIIYRLFNQFDHEIPVYSNPIGGVQIFEYNITPISK